MTNRAGRDSPAPRRILIIKPSSLGDIVHGLPVLAALRVTWPDAHIAWLAGRSFAPLLQGHPLLDEVISFDRARFGRLWRSPATALEFVRFLRALRRRGFDLVVDLQGLARSAIMALASGAPRRIGFRDARECAWLGNSESVRPPRDCRHAVDRNLLLARQLGVRAAPAEFPLGLTPADDEAARAALRSAAGRAPERFIAVVPGARWESKLWPPERLGEAVRTLLADGAPLCVLLGTREDRGYVEQMGLPAGAAVDLIGRTSLRELAALLGQAAVVLCHDSGPMHIAAALGRPIVALFGPTDPARTGPYGSRAAILTHAVPCAPCLRRTCPLRHQACLRELDVATVVAAVRSRLE